MYDRPEGEQRMIVRDNRREGISWLCTGFTNKALNIQYKPLLHRSKNTGILLNILPIC